MTTDLDAARGAGVRTSCEDLHDSRTFRCERANDWPHDIREPCGQIRVQSIRLRTLTRGPRKVAYLSRIYDDEWQGCGTKCRRTEHFVPASGFQHDQRWQDGGETPD